MIDHATRMVKQDPPQAMAYITKLKEKLRNMRKAGLEDQGEMSPDNLAYKTMRRNGLLEKLRVLFQQAYTDHMSLDC